MRISRCSARAWRIIQILALWQEQAICGGSILEEGGDSSRCRWSRLLGQGRLGRFCRSCQKGVLCPTHEAKLLGLEESDFSLGDPNVSVAPPKSCHLRGQEEEIT